MWSWASHKWRAEQGALLLPSQCPPLAEQTAHCFWIKINAQGQRGEMMCRGPNSKRDVHWRGFPKRAETGKTGYKWLLRLTAFKIQIRGWCLTTHFHAISPFSPSSANLACSGMGWHVYLWPTELIDTSVLPCAHHRSNCPCHRSNNFDEKFLLSSSSNSEQSLLVIIAWYR